MIYNGFRLEQFKSSPDAVLRLRQELGLEGRFVVGSFSRLSPWKGQHILLEALVDCPKDVMALFVGDALFGEDAYVERLHRRVAELGLGDRVKFLGFRADISELMSACDLIAHTSTSAEPFGRVIVEAMLCQRPVVATAAGGVVELIESGHTGWLVSANDPGQLSTVINQCRADLEQAETIAQSAYHYASQTFHLEGTCQKVAQLLKSVTAEQTFTPGNTGAVL